MYLGTESSPALVSNKDAAPGLQCPWRLPTHAANDMFRLVYRQLLYEPWRTVFTCGAIAGALAVILLLEAFQQGLLLQLKNAVLNRGADLIVTQAGVSNFIGSRSLLPQLSRARIEAVEGVKEAHPMTMVPVIYQQDGHKRPIFFVVYDTAGGPASLAAGNPARKPSSWG